MVRSDLILKRNIICRQHRECEDEIKKHRDEIFRLKYKIEEHQEIIDDIHNKLQLLDEECMAIDVELGRLGILEKRGVKW